MRARWAHDQARDLERRIAGEITVALLNVNTAAERVDLSARLMEQAAQALDLASRATTWA